MSDFLDKSLDDKRAIICSIWHKLKIEDQERLMKYEYFKGKFGGQNNE